LVYLLDDAGSEAPDHPVLQVGVLSA
jgi:hypothetical protein